jgi:hypothetical protein
MRYFFGFLLAIGLVVITFILVLRGFRGNSASPSISAPLTNYTNTDTTVQFTDDGAVTADQTHQGVRISVGQYATTIQVYQGYQNDITSSQTYENNPNSYGTFLRALELLDYTSGDKNPSSALADPRGVCPQGQHYSFQIISGDGTNIQNYWTTSCGSGTYKGNLQEVENLFQTQVPNYSRVAGNVAL